MRRLALLLSILFLAGCFTSGKRGAEKGLAIHDLGMPTSRLVSEERKSPIAVEVRVPLWMDTLGVNYRLAYADTSRLREYSQVRWAGAPARMVQQRLMQQLGMSNSGQVGARCLLLVEINEFSQVFLTPDRSKGVLQGRAIWLDRSRRQLAELNLEIEKSAYSQDSVGGVRALQSTVEQLTGDLLNWEKQLLASGKIAACSG
ncbi:MAG: ABC-type transport auxiliary lipoprotein family protein [Azonexus sp.]|nr:ABC-type transport auxiliary lipoprotein family protein [Azonexus sp.]